MEYDEGSQSDDEYFDRTLKKNKWEINSINAEEKKKYLEKTTENYWQLKEKLEKNLTLRHEFNLELVNLGTKKIEDKEDEDELD